MLITSAAFLLLLGALFKNLRNGWFVLHIAFVLGSSWFLQQEYEFGQFTEKTLVATIIIHFISINIVIFVMYFLDKRAAIKGAWRIPERVFHNFTFIGGNFGALLGQKIFKHKKAKKSFMQMFVAVTIMQVVIAIGILYYFSKGGFG